MNKIESLIKRTYMIYPRQDKKLGQIARKKSKEKGRLVEKSEALREIIDENNI